MLKSVLLHLDGSRRAQRVIDLGMALAYPAAARVRGLSVVDTRRLDEMVASESAVYATTEVQRLSGATQRQAAVHEVLDRMSGAVGIECDTKGLRGDPLVVLPREAKYHDLVITSHAPAKERIEPGELSAWELVDLLMRGVVPMLVTRGAERSPGRVLLVYDGTEASGRAIRTFLSQEIFPEADCRLLCVGGAADSQGRTLRDMAEYCRIRRPELETGSLRGPIRRVLLPYAEKWQAEMVVMGVSRRRGFFGRLIGQSALDVLKQSDLALYATA